MNAAILNGTGSGAREDTALAGGGGFATTEGGMESAIAPAAATLLGAMHIEDVPLEETPLFGCVRALSAKLPLRAAWLHNAWDHRVRPALRQVMALRAELDATAKSRQATRASLNADLDAHRADIERQARDAAAPFEERLAQHRAAVASAHAEAARRVALTGGVYDAKNPLDETQVLRHRPRPLDTLAGSISEILPTGEAKKRAPAAAQSLLIGVVGAMVGLSLGIITHLLYPDTVLRHWPVSVVCIAIGVGIASGIKRGSGCVWRLAGQHVAFGKPEGRRNTSVAVATVTCLAMLCADMACEQKGLLAVMRSQAGLAALVHRGVFLAQSDGPSLADSVTCWMVAMLISIGLIVTAAVEGYDCGKGEAVDALLRSRQHEEFASEDVARRSDPDVKAALNAIAHVGELMRREAEAAAQAAEASRPFEAALATLEAQRQEGETHQDSTVARLEAAERHLARTLDEFESELRRAMDRCEPFTL